MEELTPEQKELYDVVGRGRAQVAGPFGVWLRNPPLADAANRVTLALRENGKLDKRLFELIVLTAARAWGASYAWVAHEKAAVKAGLAPEIIEALRLQHKPDFRPGARSPTRPNCRTTPPPGFSNRRCGSGPRSPATPHGKAISAP